MLWIFRKAIEGFESDRPGGLQNIQLDFASLRNDRRSQDALATLAKRAARDLDYASSIEDASFRDLVSVDLFEETDQKIISDLARAVAEQTVTAREVAEVVRARQSSVWIDGYRQLYTAIAQRVGAADRTGIARPRRAVVRRGAGALPARVVPHRPALPAVHLRPPHVRRPAAARTRCASRSRSATPTSSSTSSATLGSSRSMRPTSGARPFFARKRPSIADYVEPLVRDGDKKAVVIISDALRYEVADELGSRIRQEDRFDATLDAVLGVLPSYTQLGMAALLPHSTLKHSADAQDGARRRPAHKRNRLPQQDP